MIAGRSGSGSGGRSANAERSLKGVKTALGGTPRASSISSPVNVETARVESARRTAASATRSASGVTSRRPREPYRRVNVFQSPWTSTTTFTRRRASVRPSMAAAPRKGSDAKTTSGSNSWISRRRRKGRRR